MRKVILVAIVLLPTLLVCSTATQAQSEPTNTYIVGGAMYDNTDGFSTVVGTAGRLSGPVWIFAQAYVDPGQATAFDGDIVAMGCLGNFRYGVLAGPNTNWIGDEDIVNYVAGAAGLIGGYINDRTNFGVLVAAKYKFGPDNFRDGWQVGIGLTYGL